MPRIANGILAAMSLLASSTASSAERPQWWGVASVASHHFESADKYLGPGRKFNESNWGLGIEAQWRPRHGAAAGCYRNSVDENSCYALYQYTPISMGRFVRVGGMVGLVNGYPGYNNGDFAPGGGFVLKAEGRRMGANLILLPRIPNSTPWVLGLQVKVRLGK